MKKIKMIFERQDHKVLDEYIPEYKDYDKTKLKMAVKIDGTACMIKDGKFYKRYDNKKNKPIKPEWIECYKNDSHWIFWVPVEKFDKYHWEGWNNLKDKQDGTYELVGPRINGNRHGFKEHILILHKSLIHYCDYQIKENETKQTWTFLMLMVEMCNVNKIKDIEGFVLWDIEKTEPMFKIRKRDLQDQFQWKSLN